MMAIRPWRLLIPLVGLCVLSLRAHSQPIPQDSVSRLIAAIPDSQVRRLLQTAAHSPGLAGVLARMLSYEAPLAARRTTGVAFPLQHFGPPRIPDSALADVRPYSTNPIIGYRGGYVITDTALGRLVGQLDSIATPFQLFYKLPENRKLPNVRPGMRLQLRLIDEAYGMSRHRTVFLTNEAGTPVLLYYSDGGPRPHQFLLTDPPIRITQQTGGRGGRGGGGGAAASAVNVELGGQAANGLRPGQRGQIEWQGRRFEVVVLESAVSASPNPSAEGDRYHVTVLVSALP